MSFFNSGKQKLTREIKGGLVSFNTNCYKMKSPKRYKAELLKKIIGTTSALAVINTKFMYKEQKSSFMEAQRDLPGILESYGIQYSRIPVKRAEEYNVFGLVIKQGDSKVYQDYVIGLLVDADNIDVIEKLLDKYSLYYYIDSGERSGNEIMEIFESRFDKEEELRSQFRYFAFNDNMLDNMVVYCRTEDEKQMSGLLESFNSSYI
jgi:hypothetical protein